MAVRGGAASLEREIFGGCLADLEDYAALLEKELTARGRPTHRMRLVDRKTNELIVETGSLEYLMVFKETHKDQFAMDDIVRIEG